MNSTEEKAMGTLRLTETPYERGFYEGSRGLPVTLYAMQKDQNDYERGRQDGVKAKAEYEGKQ